jgi:cytochrome oxidase Cu insertion factor (SCO1/SenC/PrrC family)
MRIIITRATAVVLLAIALTVLPAQAAPSPAPAFSLKLFNGQTLQLADLKGKGVVLLFWAQW